MGIRSIGTRQSRISLIEQTAKSEPKISKVRLCQLYAYTDLLLHDMGSGLDDGVKEKDAQSNEWRTPPLWGIGIVANSPDARFLHDGRAKTLDEAIQWHGGKAQSASTRFNQLNEQDKSNFMAFLKGI